jgi:nicotinamidase-related amidase
MITGGPGILVTLEEKLRPEHSGLVIVDMVNDLTHPEGKAVTRGGRNLDHISAAIPRMQRLIEAARAAGTRVFHVQHTTLAAHESDSGPWVDARSRAPYSAHDICMDGTWGQEVITELAPQPGEARIRKHRYSAFAGTNLDVLLRSARIETVVCCGSSTNVCVESTARSAFDHDYYVVWPSDASGSWSPELHDAALKSASRRYATVCTTEDVVKVWQKS